VQGALLPIASSLALHVLTPCGPCAWPSRLEAVHTLTLVIARLVHARTSAAFYAWRENSAECAAEFTCMARSLGKLLGSLHSRVRAVRAAFASPRLFLTRPNLWMFRILTVLRHQAWNRWRQVHNQIQQGKQTLRKALIRLVYARISAVFTLWRDRCAELRRQKAILSGALSRLSRLQVSFAFEAWHGLAATLTSEQNLLARIIGRFLERQLCAAFPVWRTEAQRRKREYECVYKVVSALVKGQLKGGLLAWRGVCGAHREASVLIRQMLSSQGAQSSY